MLKTLPPNAFAGLANAKCGEIFCQSSTSFSIICTFCEIKCFKFKDFLLHFKNAHFENDLLKTDELPVVETERITLKQETDAFEPANDLFAQHDHDDDWYSNDGIDDDSFNTNGNNNSCLGEDENYANKDVDTSTLDDGVAKIVNWQTSGKTATTTITRTSRQSQKRLNIPTNSDNIEYELDSDCDNADADEDSRDQEYKPPKQAKQNVYKCENCERVYLSKGAHTQHMKREHSHSECVICAECQLELPGPRQHDHHAVEMHGGLPCIHGCGKRYKCRRELKRHEIKHTGERSVPCDFEGCTKRFFTMRNMHSHRKVHSLEKNFVCENCGYSCRNKETLRVHSRTHTGERPYACKVCPKSFPSHSGLREHEVMHSSVRPHVCAVCGATFARQKALYHHKFLHLEQKKFVCKICGNAFAQQAGLAGHMRKHKEGAI